MTDHGPRTTDNGQIENSPSDMYRQLRACHDTLHEIATEWRQADVDSRLGALERTSLDGRDRLARIERTIDRLIKFLEKPDANECFVPIGLPVEDQRYFHETPAF